MDHLLPFATAFGLALFHSLWVGGVLYIAVRAVFPLFRTPAARHNLAYGAANPDCDILLQFVLPL
jgi:hypothetical protein